MAMQSLSEAGERDSVACPRSQGLSRRAHAFSVEALVGNSRKRMKVEKTKNEKIEASDCDLDTSTGTVVDEGEDSGERVLIYTVCICALTLSARLLMLAKLAFLLVSQDNFIAFPFNHWKCENNFNLKIE